MLLQRTHALLQLPVVRLQCAIQWSILAEELLH